MHTSEIEALRVAIKREERAYIDKYTVFVETIREPLIRDVFAHALEEDPPAPGDDIGRLSAPLEYGGAVGCRILLNRNYCFSDSCINQNG